MSFTQPLLVLSFFCLAAALTDEDIREQWVNFNLKYGKKQRSMEEDGKRFENFKNNLEQIYEHNKLFEQNRVSYQMAINPFADMDMEEMEKYYMGLKVTEDEKSKFLQKAQFGLPPRRSLHLPASKDWREVGAITPVKNQKFCSSCWAFASTGALEAHYFLKYKVSVNLSEQNLVDCVTSCAGCGGGHMIPAFNYIRKSGISSEDIYPYEGYEGLCRFPSLYSAATCRGYQKVRPGDEQHMLEIVATKGPVAVGVEANQNFRNYHQGVYNDATCGYNANHAVLVVGYGTENGQDYWLVKNSWGLDWGDEGYIKMARNRYNQCSIASYAVYPKV